MSNQLASVWAARTASRSNRFPAVVLHCRSFIGMAGLFLGLCFFCEAKGDIVWTIGTVTIQKSDLRSDQVNRVSVPVYASSVHSFLLSGYNFSFEVGSDNLNGENSLMPHGIEFDATNLDHVGASNSLLTAGWNLLTNAYPTQLQRQGTDLVVASNIPNFFTEIQFMGAPKAIFNFEFTVPHTIAAGTIIPINWAPSLDDPAFADELLNEHSYNAPNSRPFILNNGGLIVAVPEPGTALLAGFVGMVSLLRIASKKMRRRVSQSLSH